MKKHTGIAVLFFLISLQATSQEQLRKRQQANNLFERYEYFKSLDLYLPLAKKAPADVALIEQVAACYRLMNKFEDAEIWYGKAIQYSKAHTSSYLYFAEALLNNQKFDLAKVQFKYYYSITGNEEILRNKLASLDSASMWIKHESRYKVENSKALNSIGSDWGLTYYGKTGLIFTSDRSTKKGTYNWTGSGWLKPYLVSVTGKFLGELNLLMDVEHHIGPIAFNGAGDTAYITVTTQVPAKNLPVRKTGTQNLYARRLEIIIASKSSGKWGDFKSFAFNKVAEYSVGHAALSVNGQVLYFTSDMPGGEGSTDIWYCEKLPGGLWSNPINCGKTINTSQEEAFPTTGSNNQLYFSSKGWQGMGGFDIFSAKGEKSTWENPINLKSPVNSTADDFYFTTRNGVDGYLSSNRAGGLGSDDIYAFSYILPRPDFVTKAPLYPAENLIPQDGKLVPGKSYILKNIYYDLDKADIRPDAALELDKLFVILKQYPALKIELSSHTDSRASAIYNMQLSQRRAKVAVNYLIKRGISADRLLGKGYGEERLLNGCVDGVICTDDAHQMNRRTEVKVMD